MAQIVQAGGIVLLDRGWSFAGQPRGSGSSPRGMWRRRQVFFKAGKINYLLGDDEYLVHLFAMEARERLPFWRYHKDRDAFFFSPEEALERVTFPDTREVLERVLARLDRFYFPAGRRGPLEDGV